MPVIAGNTSEAFFNLAGANAVSVSIPETLTRYYSMLENGITLNENYSNDIAASVEGIINKVTINISLLERVKLISMSSFGYINVNSSNDVRMIDNAIGGKILGGSCVMNGTFSNGTVTYTFGNGKSNKFVCNIVDAKNISNVSIITDNNVETDTVTWKDNHDSTTSTISNVRLFTGYTTTSGEYSINDICYVFGNIINGTVEDAVILRNAIQEFNKYWGVE